MNAEILLKAVADATRLKILSALAREPKFVEQLAKELDITVSTASFHLKKLQAVGFVVSKKEQYYQTYSLNRDALDHSLLDIALSCSSDNVNDFATGVIAEYFEAGKLKTLPVPIKKREVVLREIAKRFKVGHGYTDRQVHLEISKVFDDFIVCKQQMLELNVLRRVGEKLYLVSKNKPPTKKSVVH